jgi:hypothetical protein
MTVQRESGMLSTISYYVPPPGLLYLLDQGIHKQRKAINKGPAVLWMLPRRNGTLGAVNRIPPLENSGHFAPLVNCSD